MVALNGKEEKILWPRKTLIKSQSQIEQRFNQCFPSHQSLVTSNP